VESNPEEGTVTGAAMVTSTDNGPLLYLLFVAPQCQRRGLATALVSAAINELHELGEKTLTSRYHIGNEQSLNWHQRFGFIEEPDLRRARLYMQQARVELWRREQIGPLPPEEREKLTAAVTRWESEVENLERIEDQYGFDAVHPMTRW
jgi:GNAT superfamily N-acetyltransferase